MASLSNCVHHTQTLASDPRLAPLGWRSSASPSAIAESPQAPRVANRWADCGAISTTVPDADSFLFTRTKCNGPIRGRYILMVEAAFMTSPHKSIACAARRQKCPQANPWELIRFVDSNGARSVSPADGAMRTECGQRAGATVGPAYRLSAQISYHLKSMRYPA